MKSADADLPWRVATGWIRSASGAKIVELGTGHASYEDAHFMVNAVNRVHDLERDRDLEKKLRKDAEAFRETLIEDLVLLQAQWSAEIAQYDTTARPSDPEDWMEGHRECRAMLGDILSKNGVG